MPRAPKAGPLREAVHARARRRLHRLPHQSWVSHLPAVWDTSGPDTRDACGAFQATPCVESEVAMLPRVAELLVLEDHPNEDARCIRVRLESEAEAGELARRLAIDIVHRLTEPVREGFDRWYVHLNGGQDLEETDKAEMLAYVGADFLNPADTTRIEGAVVEHLWASVAEALEGGWGRPFYVEHDHFSVIDHGPDGLSVYDVGEPDLGFRLWESKRHAAERKVTLTISTVARQLRTHGAEYLARMSKVLQTNPNQRVAHLGGTVVRAWKEGHPTAAVGVSVGRSTGGHLPDRPFIGLRRAFRSTIRPDERAYSSRCRTSRCSQRTCGPRSSRGSADGTRARPCAAWGRPRGHREPADTGHFGRCSLTPK